MEALRDSSLHSQCVIGLRPSRSVIQTINFLFFFLERFPVSSSKTIQPAAKRRYLVAPCVSAGVGKRPSAQAPKVRHCATGTKRVPALPGLDDLFVDDPRPYGTWLFNVGPSGLGL